MILYNFLIWCFLISLISFSESKAEESSIFAPAIQINGSVVTVFELDQRVKFITALKLPGNPYDLAKAQLIEERLKQGEASRLNIIASDTEIEDALERFASRANLSGKGFIAEMNNLGIYADTFRSYIKTELEWEKVALKKFRKQSTVSERQLQRSKSLANFEDTVQVLLTEIIIPFTNKEVTVIENIANQLKNIKSIEEFSSAAKKYSKAPTAEFGGRIKWQNFNELPEVIKPFIFNLSPSEVTEPIRLNKAIALFQLRDIREKKDINTEVNFVDFITVDTTMAKLAYLKDIEKKYHNCSDLTAAIGNKTDVKLIRSKLSSEQLPKPLALVLEKLDPKESEIIIDYEKPKLVRLCERDKKANLSNKKIENDKNILQTTRLKYLARSFLETLKDNARIVIK